MTEKNVEPMIDAIEQTTEGVTEELVPLEQLTIEVLKAKGSVKTPRKTTVIIIQSGTSIKYGKVQLACSPKGNIWYVVTEHPVEDSVAPAPYRHEREAIKIFNAFCQAE